MMPSYIEGWILILPTALNKLMACLYMPLCVVVAPYYLLFEIPKIIHGMKSGEITTSGRGTIRQSEKSKVLKLSIAMGLSIPVNPGR